MSVNEKSLLNALFRDIQDPVIIADLNSSIVDVNAACEQVFGYPHAALVGRSVADFCADAASIQSIEDEFVGCIRDLNSKAVWLGFRRSDGAAFNTRSTLVALKDCAGFVTGYALMIQALPAEVEDFACTGLSHGNLYTDLRLQRNKYRNTPAMLHSVDQSGRIQHVSRAWLDRFGYREDEVIGQRSTEFVCPESQERASGILEEIRRNGRCVKVPLTFLTKAGVQVEVELSAIIETTESISTILAILEDVTERNRAIRQLRDQADELRNFAHIAAHDLQAPLRHISVFSKLIEDDLDNCDYANAQENAQQIQQCANRLRGMVQGLLQFSISTENRIALKQTALGDVVEDALGSMQEKIDRSKAQISVNALPTVTCDPVLTERVVANVIENAIKYVAPGVAPEIHISACSYSAAIQLRIADNGIGIAENFRERVFDPLKRLHGEDSIYPGFGIGLALCRKIVEAHLGRIWVEPNAAGGSTFFIQLPDLEEQTEGKVDTAFKKAVGD